MLKNSAPTRTYGQELAVARIEEALSLILGGSPEALGLGKINVITSQEIGAQCHPLNGNPSDSVDDHECLLAFAKYSAAQAFYDPVKDSISLIADRIPIGRETAVFMHEITHKYGRAKLGHETWSHLVETVKEWKDHPDGSHEKSIYTIASEKAFASEGVQPGARQDEELFGYAVEAAIKRGVSPSAQAHKHSSEGWLDAVIASLEKVAENLTGKHQNLALQDIVNLSYALAQLETPEHSQRINQALEAMTTKVQRYKQERLEREQIPPPTPIWYSALLKAVEMVPDKIASGTQWTGILHNLTGKGVKPDEIAWSGINDWLSLQNAPLHKESILSYLSENGIKIEEKIFEITTPDWDFDKEKSRWIRGDEIIDFGPGWVNLYDKHTRRNSQNTLHFFGHDGLERAKAYNPVAAIDSTSFSDCTLPMGENYRELLLTLPQSTQGEFQSHHWRDANVLAHVRFNERTDANGLKVLFIEEIQSDWAQAGRLKGFTGSGKELKIQSRKISRFSPYNRDYPATLPQAPFVQTTDAWVALTLKRMIRYAVDHKFERIAFINGEQLIEHMGAKKISDVTPQGMGASHFYEEVLPNIAKAVLENLCGPRMTSSEFNFDESEESGETEFNYAFDVTPEMRACVLGGMPLFSLQDDSQDQNDKAESPAG